MQQIEPDLVTYNSMQHAPYWSLRYWNLRLYQSSYDPALLEHRPHCVLHLLIGYQVPEKNHAQGRGLMAAVSSRAAFEQALRAFSDGGDSGSESEDEGEEGIHDASVSFGAPSRQGRAPGYQIKLDLININII